MMVGGGNHGHQYSNQAAETVAGSAHPMRLLGLLAREAFRSGKYTRRLALWSARLLEVGGHPCE